LQQTTCWLLTGMQKPKTIVGSWSKKEASTLWRFLECLALNFCDFALDQLSQILIGHVRQIVPNWGLSNAGNIVIVWRFLYFCLQ
jgi:hypothetical protein